jgi:hypothetical protein
MGKKHHKDKEGARKINVEIAPGNQMKLEAYIEGYNARPDRKTPKVKYTDVLNAALDQFLDAHLDTLRSRLGGKKK